MEPLDTEVDPRVVGPFELLARLGAGGMGVAYLARGIPLDSLSGEVALTYNMIDPDYSAESDESRLLVVKMIQPQLLEGDPQARERFGREIDAVRAVASDRVPALIAYAEDPEIAEPWFAMDYIAGPSLRTLVKESGPLKVGPYAALGLALVDALHAIHDVKLLHRDLKPANVVLGPDGPVVLDFGLAVLTERASTQALTQTGAQMGTRPYMPLEQLQDTKHVDRPADVYALGATLFFALTGRPPYPVVPLPTAPKWDGIQSDFIPLLAQVLVPAPGQRPDLDAVEMSLCSLLAGADLTPKLAAEQLRALVAGAHLTPELPPGALTGSVAPAVRELAQQAIDADLPEVDADFYGIVDTDEIERTAGTADEAGPAGGYTPTLVDPQAQSAEPEPGPPPSSGPVEDEVQPADSPGPAPESGDDNFAPKGHTAQFPGKPDKPRQSSSPLDTLPAGARKVAARLRKTYAHRAEL
ncbi:serine/threonine-protein kinase [Streptomyces diacarni]|nr:serine/threonine-protein kinase [Streptomyces diacarni]